MFESLSAEQIANIHNDTIKFKKRIINLYRGKNKNTNRISNTISDPNSIINETLYSYTSFLIKNGIKVTDDIKNAIRVFTVFSMSDEEFLEFKTKFNSDYEKMGKLYSVTAVYPRCRYKILLQKRRDLLKDQAVDDIVETISEQASIRKEYKR